MKGKDEKKRGIYNKKQVSHAPLKCKKKKKKKKIKK
jgi:hypothetical protein